VQPKKRGRPVKASAAALVKDVDKDDTEDPVEPPKKRGRPAKASTAELVEDVDGDGDAMAKADNAEEDDQDEASGKQYWLMKAEQEDREETARDGTVSNTRFTIDDLREKTAPELWDGVRNLTAAKNLRAMRKGDLAFFYASGGKKGRKPGITGIIEIVSEAEPDVTAESEDSIYYEAHASKRKSWVAVGVEFRQKLETPIYLAELQEFRGPGAVLSDMQLHTLARLSVSKVSPKEWRFITEK
ncbi:DUF55-domain-containing protein, partial [Teratosphaeria nubilosa]